MLTRAELQDAKKALEQVERWEENKEQLQKKAEEQDELLRAKINLKELILVHITDYFPEKGIILPRGDIPITIENKKFYFPRETIHFCLNGPVGSHMMGDWSGKKYAILIPMDTIFHRIYSLAPEDTFIIGAITLPKGSEILGSAQDLKNKNPGYATLIETPPLTHDLIRQRIKDKGYIVMTVGAWNWGGVWDKMSMAYGVALDRLLSTNADPKQVLSHIAKKTRRSSGSHNTTDLHEIEEIFSRTYSMVFEHKQLEFAKGTANMCKRISEKLKQQLKYLKTLPNIYPDEEKSIQRITKLLDYLPHELEILPECERRLIRGIEEMTTSERKWLLREFSILKNFQNIALLKNKKTAKSWLSTIGRCERKAYRLYTQLHDKIKQLKVNKSIPSNFEHLEQELAIEEGSLAYVLSEVSGELTQLIEHEMWDEAINRIRQMIGVIEQACATMEKMLTTLSEREKYYRSLE